MIASGFGDALLRILRAWSDASKAHQRELLRLAVRKYDQLEGVHELFTSELQSMRRRLREIGRMHRESRDREEALREIGTLIRESAERRRQGRPQRLSLYAEAKVHSEEEFANRRGVFKTVPEAVVRATKQCMAAYASYFEADHENVYFHELERAGYAVRDVATRMRSSPSHHLVEETLISAIDLINYFEQNCDLKWLEFSRSYYRLRVELAEAGVFAGQLENKSGRARKQVTKPGALKDRSTSKT